MMGVGPLEGLRPMITRHRTLASLTVACLTGLAGIPPARAADTTELTVYRSDNAALYASSGDGGIDDGYAVVREQRALTLAAGTHDLVLGNLPRYLDPEALALDFPGGEARVISQQFLLGQGNSAALSGLIGRTVYVLGSNGQSLANGTLLRAGDGLLVRDGIGSATTGNATLVSRYAAVRSSGDDFPTGSSLRLRVDATHAGQAQAALSYPTAGLGWRAAYVATLQPGTACRMQFQAQASIANRSGRDWHGSRLTLIAGEPNMAKPSAPLPMLAMVRQSKAALPQQDTLADYRSYTLPAPVDLPDGSVSQVPLYAPRTLECTRTALVENGNEYVPQQPVINPDDNQNGSGAVISTLQLRAFDSLPAGYLRVLTADKQGTPQFIGEGRIEDTPKASSATITLGTAFDLRAQRTRTSFHVDKAGRTLDEAFRIALGNASDSPRVVTVREHPSRWRQWTLVSSSSKPSEQAPDTLTFRIEVPASGKANLDYAVRYTWTAEQNPQ
jgi:hypothetical protein